MKPAALITAALLAATAAPAAAKAPVVIQRDSWGIAHISGASDADAVYGMIYAQAEDDFNRIETNYLTALGRLAEADGEGGGEGALWQDLRQRMFFPHALLKAEYARAPAWLKALCRAWADGLNAYLADHPGTHPRVIRHFEPWMALSFTEGSIGGDVERVPVAPLQGIYGGGKTLALASTPVGPALPQGSNGMAVGPSHSANGHALLLINPHTSFFFRSEQQVTSQQGLNAYGASTWGQFFIYQGFNEKAGWMHTTSSIQRVDRFAESVVMRHGQPFARHGGKLEPLQRRPITLSFRRADGTLGQRTITTWASRHGPITAQEGDKWIASAMMVRPLAALEQSFLRTKVHNLAEFRRVGALKANSSNDTLFADSKGEFAYFHPQFVPVRNARADYRHPVNGADPANDWRGTHSLASLPQVVNPANGWVFNVNDGPWWAAGKDSPKRTAFPPYMDASGADARTPHAARVLGANPRFTLDGLIQAAYDPWLPEFARQLPLLFAADQRQPDPARAAAIALLKGWDCRWSAQSTATSLAVFWAEALSAMGEADAARADLSEQDWMASRASDAQRLAALDQAMARLTADFGGWQVPWGEINRYQRNDGAIRQSFDDAKSSRPVPFASSRWGSLAAFEAKAYPGTHRWYGTRGNSFVAVVEFGPKVVAKAVSAGGQNGDPANPHFADQAQRYADGALRPVWFYPEDLAGHVVSRRELKR
ncbi:MAG: penicillin acylase family protein [Proteobacteria bacterium]|nr:penicillin acylase family protein [Pseudomonadota bacterium]